MLIHREIRGKEVIQKSGTDSSYMEFTGTLGFISNYHVWFSKVVRFHLPSGDAKSLEFFLNMISALRDAM